VCSVPTRQSLFYSGSSLTGEETDWQGNYDGLYMQQTQRKTSRMERPSYYENVRFRNTASSYGLDEVGFSNEKSF
jgi:hypothetical protein